jgi:hypothetical protein
VKTIPTWVNLDIRPADGWKALYHDDDQPEQTQTRPLAGWLIQVEDILDGDTHQPIPGQPPLTERERRIVAAVAPAYGGAVEDATDFISFWRLLGPGEPMPDEDEKLMDEKVKAWVTYQGKRLEILHPPTEMETSQ